MVSYATGSCSKAERIKFETHCLSCDECVATLAIVLREKASARLYRSGVEAANIAREDQKRKSRRQSRASNKQSDCIQAAAAIQIVGRRES
jgi:hypothetical protein